MNRAKSLGSKGLSDRIAGSLRNLCLLKRILVIPFGKYVMKPTIKPLLYLRPEVLTRKEGSNNTLPVFLRRREISASSPIESSVLNPPTFKNASFLTAKFTPGKPHPPEKICQEPRQDGQNKKR